MADHRISGLPDPIANSEAARKKYIDDLIAGLPPPGAPSGLIAMWHGLLINIPTGWHLCDGTTGTPDLRSKFIKGAAPAQEPGTTGGAASHDHDQHPSLSHSSAAVTDHATQAHSGTAIADHAAKNTNVADVGATKQGNTASTLTLKAHLHPISAYTHSVTQPAAHPALIHSVTQPSAHPALIHNVTQPSAHPAQTHSLESNEPEYYEIAFIMKL